ncbi:hypothetical protein KIH86_17680 [Paenibacillus sp. HN-1]|uniref:DUF7210 family protein n=1 Tax=Paenibacillus TaxID=44249 RepID=UPI001CA87E9A|nr:MULTISPECIES: hypothetical protein [Paenibacillus]MBY9078300.1 hypothetical protein [Paenibacillus sp. CGMCC 1.18879]MBY9086041.1 hypothetical protein [Paenibacillus sinensis]
MKVQVNEIPIRHDGTRYEKGESFSLPDAQYERIKDHVTVLEETDAQSVVSKSKTKAASE